MFLTFAAATSLATMPVQHNVRAIYEAWANDNLVFVLSTGLPLPMPCRAPTDENHQSMFMAGCHAVRPDGCARPRTNEILEVRAG
jgi:hypothetical protein